MYAISSVFQLCDFSCASMCLYMCTFDAFIQLMCFMSLEGRKKGGFRKQRYNYSNTKEIERNCTTHFAREMALLPVGALNSVAR